MPKFVNRIITTFLIGAFFLGPAYLSAEKKATKILILKARDLSISKVKGSPILFKPGRRVRRSSYKTYRFNSKEFREKIGDPKKVKRLKIKVKILSKKKSIYKPSNPNAPSPHGGFRFTEYRCVILKVFR